MTPRPIADDTQYLQLIGRLCPDNRLELLPTFLTADARGAGEHPDSPLRAELYDEAAQLLVSFRVPVGSYLTPGPPSLMLAVRAKIPFPVATREVRFYHGEVLVHTFDVGTTDPELELIWEPPHSVTGKQTITWRATHPEDKLVHCFLRYSNTDGATWQPASFPARSGSHEIDFDRFPGGPRCRVMVVATDGVRTTTIESAPFSVPIKGCQVMIRAPHNGATFRLGERVVCQGQGYYIEEQAAEEERLVWTSSRDGEIARGRLAELTALSPGMHEITLRAGTGERMGAASVSIVIEDQADQIWVLA